MRPGDEIPIKVFLRPYRGERLERDFTLKLPAGITKGEHRILLSDADVANRTWTLATSTNRWTCPSWSRFSIRNGAITAPCRVESTATTKIRRCPACFRLSSLSCRRGALQRKKAMLTSPESAREQMSLPFDYVVNGSYTLRVTVEIVSYNEWKTILLLPRGHYLCFAGEALMDPIGLPGLPKRQSGIFQSVATAASHSLRRPSKSMTHHRYLWALAEFARESLHGRRSRRKAVSRSPKWQGQKKSPGSMPLRSPLPSIRRSDLCSNRAGREGLSCRSQRRKRKNSAIRNRVCLVDALGSTGNLYIATGDQGEVHRVTLDGKEFFFKTDEAHALAVWRSITRVTSSSAPSRAVWLSA